MNAGNERDIHSWLTVFAEPGQVLELRALGARTRSFIKSHTESGFFDNLTEMAKQAALLSGRSKAVYATLNPLKPELLARRANRIDVAADNECAKDKDVATRRWLLIDVDPIRDSMISATDEEKARALIVVQSVRAYLSEQSWPAPILNDSSNGYHLLYRIELEANDGRLVERVLKALARRFDTEGAKVDCTVFNPSRIVKLPGTLSMKGDCLPKRPHRLAAVLEMPGDLEPVPHKLLSALSGETPAGTHKSDGAAPKTNSVHHGFASRLLVEKWLSSKGVRYRVKDGKTGDGRTVYLLAECPFDPSHAGTEVAVMQAADGQMSAKCMHQSCGGRGWQEFKARIGKPGAEDYDPPLVAASVQRARSEYRDYKGDAWEGDSPAAIETPGACPTCGREPDPVWLGPVARFTIRELLEQYPRLHPYVIDGLLRERETANIISVSKIGKSWFLYGLILSIIIGRPWLDRFTTSPGRVLLIDNELHKPTIAFRVKTVADAMGIPLAAYADALTVWSLRGNLRDIFQLAGELKNIGPVKLIALDAKYRATPAGTSENDNSAETALYNAIDHYAEQTGAAWINVHHSSKGSQGEKRVTDVGAGAGAQSRAADCHLILREHEEDDTIVLEAAVRSFAPVEPLALHWTFPLWTPADADPAKIRGRLTVQEQRQCDRDQEGTEKILTRLREQPATQRDLRDLGIGVNRLQRLLGILQSSGQVLWSEVEVRGNKTREYRLRGPDVVDHVTDHVERRTLSVLNRTDGPRAPDQTA